MSDQIPLHSDEVRPWTLSQAVIRATTGPPPSAPSKVWLGAWIAVILSVTVLLVMADAPAIAFSIPLGSLLLVNRCQFEVEVGDITARLGSSHPAPPAGSATPTADPPSPGAHRG